MKIKEENDSNVGKDKRKRAKVEYSEDEWRRGVMLVGKEEHEIEERKSKTWGTNGSM